MTIRICQKSKLVKKKSDSLELGHCTSFLHVIIIANSPPCSAAMFTFNVYIFSHFGGAGNTLYIGGWHLNIWFRPKTVSPRHSDDDGSSYLYNLELLRASRRFLSSTFHTWRSATMYLFSILQHRRKRAAKWLKEDATICAAGGGQISFIGISTFQSYVLHACISISLSKDLRSCQKVAYPFNLVRNAFDS